MKPQGWRVLIAGPDEGGHEAEIKAAVNDAGLSNVFQFIGAVDDERKWNLYRDADIYVLPSYSENFGVTVAEALGSGVPVITTTATPWQELETHRCGWWVEAGVEPLAEALTNAIGTSSEHLMEMGLRGRRLVEDR